MSVHDESESQESAQEVEEDDEAPRKSQDVDKVPSDEDSIMQGSDNSDEEQDTESKSKLNHIIMSTESVDKTSQK